MGIRGSHSSKKFDLDGTFREMKEAVRVRTIQVYTTVGCPHKNLHIYVVHDLTEEEDGCLLKCARDRSTDSYGDL